jgi:formylglycine-generating enzyme required for sulfatase activity
VEQNLALIELITIPGGSIMLGEEIDAHEVHVPTFQIGRFPVTAVQYQIFTEQTSHSPPPHWPNGQLHSLLTHHPVTNVSWFDALAFCRWLTDLEGKVYRLPTEAEWEKAAQGEAGCIYPWGNTFHRENCHTWEAGAGYTQPVDALPQGASPYGVMDMAGNVWEWCSTIFEDYPYSAVDGRENLNDHEAWRVLRGGSWYDTEWGVRAARRLGSPAAYASQNTGFRIASNG